MMIINLIGLGLIVLIIWWFWLYKPVKAVDVNVENITIVVDNGIYQPSRIKVSAGKKTMLKFLRKDASPCASTVLFPAFELSEELPLKVNKSVMLPPMSSGEYQFHCPMKMYTGTLIVEKE
jgi:plastocyanin domain-containing protein